MSLATLVWGSPGWWLPAATLAAAALALAVWSYGRAATDAWVRVCATTLKLLAVLALALCLIEPLFSGTRPRAGANVFVMLADNSQSLSARDRNEPTSRGESLKGCLTANSSWQTRLGQDFDLRRYMFDTQLRSVSGFSELTFHGEASALCGALTAVAQRLQGRPNAGVLLMTDGNATDWDATDWGSHSLPAIYPVVFGSAQTACDVSVQRVSVSQSNFEAAPVTITVEAACQGLAGTPFVVQLLDESGQELQRERFQLAGDDKPLVHRFQLRPEQAGVSFYRVHAFVEGEESSLEDSRKTREATLVNNTRWLAVDRGHGPYRVLYVSGRPNWDFKFLRRAAEEDEELQLVGLVRIARREPKFTFRGHQDESTNPLYRGFGNQQDEQAEQYDEPVLVRLGTEDGEELRGGFPKSAEQLFRYHAIVLDDVEAEFFTQDQLSLMQHFVSQRGGGFLMLGGRESFAGSSFDRTPVRELLPVYAERLESVAEEGYRLVLTRDGWLQPWVRLRATEADEQRRLNDMPAFRVLSGTRGIKPGAMVLAQVQTREGNAHPALVAQRFGRGRSAALLIGDLWRWNLRRASASNTSELEQFWRQTLRWLVADVPGRVEVETRRPGRDFSPLVELAVQVRDAAFRPLDNAQVLVRISTPDNKEIEVTAEPSDEQAGLYLATFTTRAPGPYRTHVAATAEDGSSVGQTQTGWCADPAMEEFQQLVPNRAALQRLAERTGGEMIEANQLDAFVRSLPNRKVPITEPWVYPLWHQWPVFLLAIVCLVGEWGLRRWKGLP